MYLRNTLSFGARASDSGSGGLLAQPGGLTDVGWIDPRDPRRLASSSRLRPLCEPRHPSVISVRRTRAPTCFQPPCSDPDIRALGACFCSQPIVKVEEISFPLVGPYSGRDFGTRAYSTQNGTAARLHWGIGTPGSWGEGAAPPPNHSSDVP